MTPPDQEAVEAAMTYAVPRTTPYETNEELRRYNLASDYLYMSPPGGDPARAAARILADEVTRLRAEMVKRPQ